MVNTIAERILKLFDKEDECPLNADQVSDLLVDVKVISKRVLRLEKIIVVSLLIIIGISFNSAERQLADTITSKVKTASLVYCSESNAATRKVLLELIRHEIPFYPEDGLCGSEQTIRKFINNYLSKR